MQTNNNQNKGRNYILNKSNTPSKDFNRTNAQEPELKPTFLSSLFKAPSDPDEAKAERDRLYGRTPSNTKISSTFTI